MRKLIMVTVAAALSEAPNSLSRRVRTTTTTHRRTRFVSRPTSFIRSVTPSSGWWRVPSTSWSRSRIWRRFSGTPRTSTTATPPSAPRSRPSLTASRTRRSLIGADVLEILATHDLEVRELADELLHPGPRELHHELLLVAASLAPANDPDAEGRVTHLGAGR